MELIHELKQMGFITLLGGPQSRQDYVGEPDTDARSHRFSGLESIVDVAVQVRSTVCDQSIQEYGTDSSSSRGRTTSSWRLTGRTSIRSPTP